MMIENKDSLTPEYDKSNWRKGEWDNEPDRVDFIHSNFSCFILRNHSGVWCGYVGVDENHKLFGVSYLDCDNFDVHGGLTYSDFCSPPICHIPSKDMPDKVWWFGFDCNHHDDLAPSKWRSKIGTYKNMTYVIDEVKSLAEQLRNYDK